MCYLHSQNKAYTFLQWKTKSGSVQKIPTVLLYDSMKKFNSLGIEAKEMYYSDTRLSKWILIEKSKMKLMDADISGISTIEVVADCLKCFLDRFSDTISTTDLAQHVFRYFLTIPANWTNNEKILMREAAMKVGINKNELQLIHEPEAAFFSFLTHSMEEKTDYENKVVIVLDAGGGTNDLTVHRVRSKDPLSIEEICSGMGDRKGSSLINEQILDWVKGMIKPDVWEEFTNERPLYGVLLDDIESLKCKLNWYEDRELATEFKEGDCNTTTYLKSKKKGRFGTHYYFLLSKQKIFQFHKQITASISYMITELIKKVEKLNLRVDILWLVGGFVNSFILQETIRYVVLMYNFCKTFGLPEIYLSSNNDNLSNEVENWMTMLVKIEMPPNLKISIAYLVLKFNYLAVESFEDQNLLTKFAVSQRKSDMIDVMSSFFGQPSDFKPAVAVKEIVNQGYGYFVEYMSTRNGGNYTLYPQIQNDHTPDVSTCKGAAAYAKFLGSIDVRVQRTSVGMKSIEDWDEKKHKQYGTREIIGSMGRLRAVCSNVFGPLVQKDEIITLGHEKIKCLDVVSPNQRIRYINFYETNAEQLEYQFVTNESHRIGQLVLNLPPGLKTSDKIELRIKFGNEITTSAQVLDQVGNPKKKIDSSFKQVTYLKVFLHTIFIIDNSQSMDLANEDFAFNDVSFGPCRLDKVFASCKALIQNNDNKCKQVFSMIRFNSESEIVFQYQEKNALKESITKYLNFEPEKSTDFLKALNNLERIIKDTQTKFPTKHIITSVIFLSDGEDPNPKVVLEKVSSLAHQYPQLSLNTIFFGNTEEDTACDLLKRMALTGNGLFVPSAEEPESLLSTFSVLSSRYN
uniref:VWFA domain-containing protein n=1 Tax=Arcella intermedia TaxID=1963864 RepID=A0A6B2KY09_9EUKA